MVWCVRIHLAFAALFLTGTLCLHAQGLKKELDPKEKTAEKAKEPEKKPRSAEPVTVESLKLPPGAVLVVVDGIQKAMKLVPNSILLTPAKYQELMDRIAELERQLKVDKKGVYACKLNGKLEGNFVRFRAEFTFTTEKKNMVVVLGLQGAHLLDEGDLDQNLPALDYAMEGFSLKVAEPGTHRLTLSFKVAVGQKRPAAGTGNVERGFDLGLPGAAVTSLNLELPGAIKEIRWNDKLENKRVGNRWELTLGDLKALSVLWKEPVTLPGKGPLLASDGVITVRLEDNAVLLQAELTLEDLRGQATEWNLLLPSQAKMEVKVPGGLVYDVFPPDEKKPYHVIRFTEPNAERFSVTVQAQFPRPEGVFRLPVGPFLVENAYRQQGTIQVLSKPESVRGQRLLFHPYGETFQRDIPKDPVNPELLAFFQYWNMTGPAKGGKGLRIPLEIEWKTEKGQVETTLEHQLKLQSSSTGLQLDLQTRIRVKSLHAGLDFIDVQLPRSRPVGMELLAWQPQVPFPGGVPWAALYSQIMQAQPFAIPTTFYCEEEGRATSPDMSPPDAQGKARIKLQRTQARDFTLLLTGRYLVPAHARRLRVELPRTLGTLDRGARGTLHTDDHLELLVGPRGDEAPVPKKQFYQSAWDPSPGNLDLAWRAYRPEFPVQGLVDVSMRGQQAHIRAQLQFTVPKSLRREGASPGQVRMKLPPGTNFKVSAGGKLISLEEGLGFAWIEPAADVPIREPLVLEYDALLPQAEDKGEGVWQVPFIWPEKATLLDAKVRVWTEPGLLPVPVDPARVWLQRGSEIVDKQNVLPALVLEGSGRSLELLLRLGANAPSRLPLLISDRALIRVSVDDSGNQNYRARYLIQKLNHHIIDVEMPASSSVQNISLMGLRIPWTPHETELNVLRLVIDPERFKENLLLDVEYKISEPGKSSWQSVLAPPSFRGDVFLRQVRWIVSLPTNWVAIPIGHLQPEYHWSLQNWLLTPQPGFTSADAERWLLGQENGEPDFPVNLAFSSQESVWVLHVPRQTWLMLCSGILLTVGLMVYFLSQSKPLFLSGLVTLGLAVACVSFIFPFLVAPVLLGIQPGALVLVVILVVNWLLQERYRRQVIFMPGFTRLKGGSSLSGPPLGNPPPREASTVDAPAGSASQPKRGSSVTRGEPS